MYRAGDFYRICDRCGEKKRASETKKEWTGLIVCDPCFETRHPQDNVRGRKDRQRVPDPRPEAPDYFLAPNEVTDNTIDTGGVPLWDVAEWDVDIWDD